METKRTTATLVNVDARMALMPSSAQVIGVFDTPDEPGPEYGFPLRLAWRLGRHHDAQWAAEDSCRDCAADDHSVAALKHAIDEMNAKRVDMVDQLDVWIARSVRFPADAPMHTETFGSVLDRLAVAWVRARRLNGGGATRRARGRLAIGQLAGLAGAYDDLVRDLVAGRRQVPFWKALKQYGVQR